VIRQAFNKKQLMVMWFVGVVISACLIENSAGITGIIGLIDWNKALIYPLIIIGGLLVITFSKRQSSEEEIAQNLEKGQRKREDTFLECWKKGMSDEELAWKLNLKIENVKALKEALKELKDKKIIDTTGNLHLGVFQIM